MPKREKEERKKKASHGRGSCNYGNTPVDCPSTTLRTADRVLVLDDCMSRLFLPSPPPLPILAFLHWSALFITSRVASLFPYRIFLYTPSHPSFFPTHHRGDICTMPPRSSLTTSFSVTDANNEVVCPLKNNDGSNCRKRCLGVSLSLFLSLSFPSKPHPHRSNDPEMRQKLDWKISRR